MAGKGSLRRPAAVSADEVARRWFLAFGAGSEPSEGLTADEALDHLAAAGHKVILIDDTMDPDVRH